MDSFVVESVRGDFPILNRQVQGHPLCYLDNAATAQKPQVVIDAITEFYEGGNANVHRGIHFLSEQATGAYEEARTLVQRFLNCPQEREVIFVRGVTEAMNLLATSFGQCFLGQGDEVLVTALEHHANIVPWQMACQRAGAHLKVVPIDDQGELCWEQLEGLLTERTRIVSATHISNAIGTVVDIPRLVALAHARGIPVAVDGAQSAPHIPVDVQALGCDFYAFSGHKVFGPTGIGVLWGKQEYLDQMPPYHGGGDMIEKVSFEGTTYKGIPAKFEAGTPHIAGGVGLAAALKYLMAMDRQGALAHEQALLVHAEEALSALPGVSLIGAAKQKASIATFAVEGIHSYDLTSYLDAEGIAVRTGLHCAEPLMTRLRAPSTLRASFAFYNTHEEVERLAGALKKAQRLFVG